MAGWHIYPVNDEREHETEDSTGECWCGPEVQWIDPETGLPYPDPPLIIHNAADCRELIEQANEIARKTEAESQGENPQA